ncbi:PKD domain-containing protein [Methanocorpusculum bavaricum]|uniref:PKD domain-containing protein n=1 Tax=Methanocorpusculum bavaricum TaxID=71518 RepID=UPI0005B2A32A|nr:PKD domain-containing protein [Methanocorpusculum bavaricum]
MILKRLILVLLAMFLVMGCVGAVSADDTPIDNIAISVTTPKTGEAPQVSLTLDNAAGTITWTPSGAKFAPGTAYTSTITVTANNGYNFTESVKVTVNDKSVDPRILTNKSFTVSQDFESTDKISLDLVNVTITAPRTGEPPATSATSDTTGVGTPSVSWDPNNSPFNSNINYTATIKVPAEPGYLFASSSTVKLNGNLVSGTKVEVSDNELTISHEFDATTPIEISYVALNLTPPATGNLPANPSSITRGVGNPTVAWSPLVPTFVEGQKYYANITIPVESTNYKFTNSPTVALNGQNIPTEEFVSRTGNQIILNHSFDATSLITRIDSVTISGVTLPVGGATKNTSKPAVSSTPSGGIASISNITWKDDSDESTSGTVFKYETVYKAVITVEAESGYKFTSESKATLNDKTALVSLNDDRTSATITYTCPKTTAEGKIHPVITKFTVTPTSGTSPLDVRFTVATTNATNVTLNFGDGTIITSTKNGYVDHTYSTAVSYYPILTATNTNGSVTESLSILVKAPLATSTPTQTAAVKSLTTSSAETGNMSMIPAPLDIIKEFMHLFYSIFDPANYLFAVNESGNTS